MELKTRIRIAIQKQIVKWRVLKMIALENSLAVDPRFIPGSETSPKRFDIPLEGLNYAIRTKRKISITPRSLPILLSTVKGIYKSIENAKKDFENPQSSAPDEFILSFEMYAKKIGIGAIGYTKVPDRYIFQNKGIRYRNAIVCSMEMDKARIDTAPSYKSLKEVLRTYHDLGKAVIKLSQFLRKNGYDAQAAHPLGGVVMMVPLAVNANIGWIGHQGLIISPEFGPRMRLAVVLTSIENLPFTKLKDNSHKWVREWCKDCNACVLACPGAAILDPTREEENGHRHYIEIEKCFPHFIEEYGCSICIKVCPFNRVGYGKVKELFEKKNH